MALRAFELLNLFCLQMMETLRCLARRHEAGALPEGKPHRYACAAGGAAGDRHGRLTPKGNTALGLGIKSAKMRREAVLAHVKPKAPPPLHPQTVEGFVART